MTDAADIQDVRDQYQAMHEALRAAREVCVDDEARPRLRQLAEAVQEVLTDLDRADLQSRTTQFQELGKRINAVNDDLETLKSEIAGIVNDVAIATKVIGAVDSVLAVAPKFLA